MTSPTTQSSISIVSGLLDQKRYESARRACAAGLQSEREANTRVELLLALHSAYRGLGDLSAARQSLRDVRDLSGTEKVDLLILEALDVHRLGYEEFYRESDEARRGLTLDQYQDICAADADKLFAQAAGLCATDSERLAVHTAMVSAKRVSPFKFDVTESDSEKPAKSREVDIAGTGRLSGMLVDETGQPVVGAEIVLGLEVGNSNADPTAYLVYEMHYEPDKREPELRFATTGADGHFDFGDVPAGRHEYIAVRRDPSAFECPTRFLAQGIGVKPNEAVDLRLTWAEWASAEVLPSIIPFEPKRIIDGQECSLLLAQPMRNPFYFTFADQAVYLDPHSAPLNTPEHYRVFDSEAPGEPIPFQFVDGKILVRTGLAPVSERALAVYESEKALAGVPSVADETVEIHVDDCSSTADVSVGGSSFRVAWVTEGSAIVAPLVAVKAVDGVWRGTGRFTLPDRITVTSCQTTQLQDGPLMKRWRTHYDLSGGGKVSFEFTAYAGDPSLNVRETSSPVDGFSFEFSLSEFSGGRGFLHWTPEHGNRHWTGLSTADRELARLQESVAWWIPPQGFGYAMTAGTLDSSDYIGVYTLRRGDWIDREFARLSQGPVDIDGSDNRELDWPYPEMVGSTISMITAETSASGDAYFKFGAFDGERQWGIVASSLDLNDGPYKQISELQHKNSSPRLDEFIKWNLNLADSVQRPNVVARRKDLLAIRAKRLTPFFEPFWDRIASDKAFGPAAGVRFVVEGDPAVAWRKKRELVGQAHIRSRMTLLGRDYSDMYSPVGGRAITQWAEDYDLIAYCGVFTGDEERLVRSFLMLMGLMFMEPDLMNWKYGSRNANFEADRVDVVGAVGLCFHGNPDAGRMLDHAVDLMRKSIDVYCTPGSGKWYENPACYYLQALKCRANLAYHLWAHKIYDVSQIPRFRDFLSWGINLLTPPCPSSYDIMRDGVSFDDYDSLQKVRRLPPVGDHAHIGPWVPELYALMSKVYREHDPEFADKLLWAYQTGGHDGGYYGNVPLLLCAMTESELAAVPAERGPKLASRKLEGFGAILRGGFASPDESYLLLKQGPGGYRYHRTEGSIILFANGRPLIYDGGEAGETWRHTTLSFDEAHMPLSAGHVERFATLGGIEFVQGVHPVALTAGQPIFLSDNCHHSLVPEAYKRYRESNPADTRSVLWMRGDYIVLHDDLSVEPERRSTWHLQAVANSETGNAAGGFRFQGRFGVDLQVLLPGQKFDSETIETVPILDYNRTPAASFAMRHLALGGAGKEQYLAVLRPIVPGGSELAARRIVSGSKEVGVAVTTDGIDDVVLCRRDTFEYNDGDISFEGRYSAVRRRAYQTDVALLSAGSITVGDVRIESDGPAASVRIEDGVSTMHASGHGRVTVTTTGVSRQIDVDGSLAGLRLLGEGVGDA